MNLTIWLSGKRLIMESGASTLQPPAGRPLGCIGVVLSFGRASHVVSTKARWSHRWPGVQHSWAGLQAS
jgi:hypothetical protein